MPGNGGKSLKRTPVPFNFTGRKGYLRMGQCRINQRIRVGKQVLFIANLAPRQFKNGLVSEGMILSAENFDGTLAVTSLLREVKPGSEVK